MLLDQPFARSAQLQAGAVHQQVQGLRIVRNAGIIGLRLWHGQCRGATAERRVVRHAQRQAEQADDRADQPFSLPIGKTEYGAQGQRRQDCQRRIERLATAGRARSGRLSRDCLIGKPHGQAAALTQPGLVAGPVRDLALLPRDVVAAILVQLERQGRHPG
jgi:hypothetical protein